MHNVSVFFMIGVGLIPNGFSASPKSSTSSTNISIEPFQDSSSTAQFSMASTLPIRAATSAVRSLPNSAPSVSLLPRRLFSTTPSPSNAADEPAQNGETAQPAPRWSYTPPRAKAPFSLHMNSRRPDFHVNQDPARLDEFYLTMLGEDGDKMLADELKWLAVTHKSFDQGRRGFNDRLAFLGA